MARSPAYDEDLIRAGLAVRLWDAGVRYGAFEVLTGLNFEARAGGLTVITGGSGAGKTALIRLLHLSVPLASGRFALFGVDASRLPPQRRARMRRRIGYLAQEPVFVDHLTAAQNVALPLAVAGARPKDYAQDIEEILAFVGCAAFADAPLQALSAGDRRRVSFARALVTKPDLILADEPTAGLAPEAAARLMRILGEMRRVGAAVVIATQDEDLAEALPAARWRLEGGRLALLAQPPLEAAQ